MTDLTKFGLRVIAVAAALGFLGDLLLHPTPWGINAPLWVGGLALAALVLARQAGLEATPVARVWAGAAAGFAVGFAWRDSAVLRRLDLLAMLVCLAFAAWRPSGSGLASSGVVVAISRLTAGLASLVFGAIPLLRREVGWAELPRRVWLQRAAAVARGLVVGVPLLLVFGGLLVSADAVFLSYAKRMLELDLPELISHAALAGACAWLAAGLLRGALLKSRSPFCGPEPGRPPLGPIEVNVILATLNVLFALFILVQLRYLFGGAEVVHVTPGVTYAEYARHGFFELVAVTALALPVLLFCDWLLLRSDARTLFRLQGAAMVAMLVVILVSAAQRLRLYTAEYGLTELRVYVAAFVAWLAAVFAWCLFTVLQNRRERFVSGALAGAGCLLLALHCVNPDDLIVRTNLARARLGKPLDARYAASLSADAFGSLAAALATLSEPERRIVGERLYRWLERPALGWRSWNWSRQNARAVLRRLEPVLAEPDTAAALPATNSILARERPRS